MLSVDDPCRSKYAGAWCVFYIRYIKVFLKLDSVLHLVT